MKKSIFIFMLIILYSCANEKKVFWCGDHVCANNKEKTLYFKKTMTVELKKIDYKENISNKDKKLSRKILLDEKKRIKEKKKLAKQLIQEEKRMIIEEKKLAKQLIREEKKRMKEEKKEAKQLLLNEKKALKKEKKIVKKSQENMSGNSLNGKIGLSNDSFSILLEKVTKRNMLRPFPDINDIPN